MNVDKTHGCLLLAVGTPFLLLGILVLTFALSEKSDATGIFWASIVLLLGAAGIICGVWLFRKGKLAKGSESSASPVDRATARAHIKIWVIVGFGFAGLYTLLAVLGFADAIRISPAVNWSVSIAALLFWIGILFAVIGQYSVARVFFLIGGILGLPLSVPMIIAGKRLELAGQALARAEESLEQPGDASAHKSAFADQLICKYCGVENHATEWPSEGDTVPFAYETEPGNFNLKVHCPHCEKNWYVVWDDNPGQLEAVSL